MGINSFAERYYNRVGSSDPFIDGDIVKRFMFGTFNVSNAIGASGTDNTSSNELKYYDGSAGQWQTVALIYHKTKM